jgi:hypothetical protein
VKARATDLGRVGPAKPELADKMRSLRSSAAKTYRRLTQEMDRNGPAPLARPQRLVTPDPMQCREAPD